MQVHSDSRIWCVLELRCERGEDNERWFCVNGGSVPQCWPGVVAGASYCSWCVVHGAGAAIDERGGRAASGAVKALTAWCRDGGGGAVAAMVVVSVGC